jgi:asparagine synthase (glutamine-hydrolysing)
MRIWLIGFNIKAENWVKHYTSIKNMFSPVTITNAKTYRIKTNYCTKFEYTFKQQQTDQSSLCENFEVSEEQIECLDGWAICSDSMQRYQNIFNPNIKPINENILNGRGEFSYFKLSNFEVILVSDFYSTSPIYYTVLNGEFLASNDLRIIVSLVGQSLEVNREKCITFLSSHVSLQENEVSTNETFYKNIYKVPPHSILKYREGQACISSYFAVNQIIKAIDYKTKDFYENFRDRFNRCTRDRANNDKIAIMLSGGIDSSTILASLKDNGLIQNVTAINMSFHDSELANTHDKEIVTQLVKEYEIKGGIVCGDELLRLPNALPGQDPIGYIDGPTPSANILAHESLSYWALQSGAKLSLTGEQGDAILGEDMATLVYGSLFNAGEYLSMFKLMKQVSQKNPFILTKNFIRYFLGNLSSLTREHLYSGSYWNHTKSSIPQYFSEDLLVYERFLSNNVFYKSREQPFHLVAHKYMYDYYFPRASYFDIMNTYIKNSHPFIDIKLLELIFSLPSHTCINYEDFTPANNYYCSKQLARQAYKNILPDCARLKKIKTSYAGMARKILLNSKRDIINLFFDQKKLLVEELNLINGDIFRKCLAKTLIKLDDPNNNLGLQYQYMKSVLHMEIWLNCLEKMKQDNNFLKIHMPRPLANIEWI